MWQCVNAFTASQILQLKWHAASLTSPCRRPSRCFADVPVKRDFKGRNSSSGFNKSALLLPKKQNTKKPHVVSLLDSLFSSWQVLWIEVIQKIDVWRDKSKQSKALQFKPRSFEEDPWKPPVMSAEWLRSECCMGNKPVLFHLGFSRQCGGLKEATRVCLDPASVNSHPSLKLCSLLFCSRPFEQGCLSALNIIQRAHIRTYVWIIFALVSEQLYSRE